MEILLALAVFAGFFLFGFWLNTNLDKKEHEEQIQNLEEKIKRLTSEKQSKAVRKGMAVEQVAGFMENFPYYGKQISACFQPVDFIVFDKDEIVVVELKTGKSNLSSKQRNIKRIINEGKVRFELIRYKDGEFHVE